MLFHIGVLFVIKNKLWELNCFSYETACENFRSSNLSSDLVTTFLDDAGGDLKQFCELVAMYFSNPGEAADLNDLRMRCETARTYHNADFSEICANIYAVWNDLELFPVGKIANDSAAEISFENSWMYSRTFGGDRGHEGCDIMATLNERGLYPIYSMTDGIVENIGWLRLGGYRIGIRSPSGAYFYYAHMSEYAKEFRVGEQITAGEHLGFMGDTGYSDIPGTTGNFPVHLHLGIYLNDENGKEYAINSYPMLKYLYDLSVWNTENSEGSNLQRTKEG